MSLRPGQRVLDRYIAEQLLGRGGMGEVWRGRHDALDQPVAIKRLTGPAHPAALERFRREARFMARVRHPHVVAVLDYGLLPAASVHEDPAPVLILELCEGGSVEDLRRTAGALPWDRAAALVAQGLEGLAAVHAAGLVHRDLKGENLLLAGGPPVVKVADFGIAHSLEEDEPRLTRPGLAIGTLGAMAPEQLSGGTVDARADLYAAGVLLWQLLAGHPPFPAAEPAELLARLWQPPPRVVVPPDRPPPPDALVDLIDRLLAPERERRPASAAGVAALLRGLLPETPVESPAASPPPAASLVAPTMPVTDLAPPDDDADLGPLANDWRAVPAATSRPAGTAVPAEGYLVAARLPQSAVRDRATRRWLAGLFPTPARCWLRDGVLLAASAQGRPDAAIAALRARWRDALPVQAAPWPEGLELTSAVMTGAAPLPPAVQALLATLG